MQFLSDNHKSSYVFINVSQRYTFEPIENTYSKTANLMCYLQTNRFTFQSLYNPFTASDILWAISRYYLDYYLSKKKTEF